MKTWRWNHWTEEHYLKFECTTQESRIWNGWLGIVVQAQDPLILTSPCLYLASTSSPSFRSSSSIPAHQSKSLLALTSCPFCMVVNQLCVLLYESVKGMHARMYTSAYTPWRRVDRNDCKCTQQRIRRPRSWKFRQARACLQLMGRKPGRQRCACTPSLVPLRRLSSAGSNK